MYLEFPITTTHSPFLSMNLLVERFQKHKERSPYLVKYIYLITRLY